MARVYSNRLSEYTHENGGRVLLLFLLFLLAIYEFATAGFPAFAIVCVFHYYLYILQPFKWRMLTFWTLIIINYFIQMKDISLPVPMSLPNEMLQIILLAIAIIDARQTPHFERSNKIMLLALNYMVWFLYIEVFNDTCNLGINVAAWYTGARLMAFQIYIYFLYFLFIYHPQKY